MNSIVAMNSLGILYPYDGMEAVGYWYNPKTGAHVTIAWEVADGLRAHADHADVPFAHPEWFALTDDELKDFREAGDGDYVRGTLVQKGWVRIGYNPIHGAHFHGKTAKHCYEGFTWFVEHHGLPIGGCNIEVDPQASWRSMAIFTIPVGEIEAYAADGRLEPIWKTR